MQDKQQLDSKIVTQPRRKKASGGHRRRQNSQPWWPAIDDNDPSLFDGNPRQPWSPRQEHVSPASTSIVGSQHKHLMQNAFIAKKKIMHEELYHC